ncbi:hypothetical protein ACS0TY_010440 [Phlomoides rotata]
MKFENQNEVDSYNFLEEPTLPFGTWEQQFPYMEGFNFELPNWFEYEQFPFANHEMSSSWNVDFEEISGDLGLWDLDDHNPNPNPNPPVLMNMQNMNDGSSSCSMQSSVRNQMNISNSSNSNKKVEIRSNGRYKSSTLQLEEIQKYFDVPITRAAKELNVGLTVLKKRCRELNIARWPHRKIKSLKSLIHNVQELGLTNEIEMLEEHKRMVERIPEMELTERTKKLRQACFKANYKKRRSQLQQSSLFY